MRLYPKKFVDKRTLPTDFFCLYCTEFSMRFKSPQSSWFKETASIRLPLGSVALLNLVTTLLNRTTIHPLVVQLQPFSRTTMKPSRY